MKVLFDVSHLLHSGADKNENYLLNGLIPAMLQIQHTYGAEVEFLNLYFGKKFSYLPGFIKKNKLHSFMFPGSVLNKLWLNFNFPDLKTFFGKFDIVHSPYYSLPVYSNAERILTVQDLKFIISPGSNPSCIIPDCNKNKLLEANIYRASKIITPSDFTKNEILKHFNISPDKINVVHNGMDNPQRIDVHDQLIFLRLQRIQKMKYIYVPNASYFSHSELQRIINAFLNSDAAEKFKLTLGFCHGDSKADNFIKSLSSQKISAVKITTPQEANILFHNSLYVLYIPEYDGSGLTLIQTFAFRKAVITTDFSALKETAGNAALKIDCNSENEIINALNLLLNNHKRKEFERKARKRSADFSWNKMASEYFHIYKKLL
jgi:glycosyltransferase involved in cell wall biosynthesis